MQKKELQELRRDYGSSAFDKSGVHPDPVVQFREWMKDALLREGEIDANAMTLATVGEDLRPNARIVLLKDIVDGSFVFFTNYSSKKGEELAMNPRCAAVFWWSSLQRQVRIEGQVSKTDPTYSSEYFESRPLGSQKGAIISPQSKVIADRAFLLKRLADLEKDLGDELPTRPEDWGGYLIKPDGMEFWQGQSSRLHDRLQYRLVDGRWIIERLAP